MTELTRYLLQALIALGLLIGLAALALWAIGRWGRWTVASGGRLELLEALALGHTARLVIVRADDRHLLLAVTAQNVTLLTELGPHSAKEGEE